MKRWWIRKKKARRRRKFNKAYKILRNEAEHHTKAGHMMDFRAVNESFIIMQCTACPDFHVQGTSVRP